MKSFSTLHMNQSRNFSTHFVTPFAINAVAAHTVAAAFLFALFALNANAQTKPAPATQPPVPVTDKSIGAPVPVAATPATAVPAASAASAAPAIPPKTFVTIGDKPAVLFDAPSTRANKIFIILRLSPLEVLVKLDKWTKVRDAENTIGWVENEALGARRHVIVSAPLADVRSAADATSTLVFETQRNVVLEVTGSTPPIGWLAVKHRDGQAGFVRVAQVWGD